MTHITAQPPRVGYSELRGLFKVCFPEEPFDSATYDELYDNRLYMAFSGDALVGLASVKQGGDNAHLSKLCVMPGHRREGIGRSLLAAAIKRETESGTGTVSLMVLAKNSIAQKLYISSGFIESGRTHRFLIGYRDFFSSYNADNDMIAESGEPNQSGKRRISFLTDQKPAGSCVFDPRFPGCSNYMLSIPDMALDSLAALKPVIGTPPSLYVLTADMEIAQICKEAGFELKDEIIAMTLSLR